MKNKLIIIIPTVLIFFIFSIVFLRFTNNKFRYSFDVNFNTTKIHESFYQIDGQNAIATLPLPPKTTFAFKHSDTAVTYYSKLSYTEFLDYYRNNSYPLDSSLVTNGQFKFIITEPSPDTDSKYYFIDIDFKMN